VMTRPRIRQFADDLGISYDEAKSLVETGRRRRDGGAEILERNMNEMRPGEGIDPGTYRPMPPKEKQPKTPKYGPRRGTPKKRPGGLGGPMSRPMKTSSKRKKYADGGSVNMSRGGGAAIKGTKFSGVY
jgi:hypothetical protein